MLSVAVAVFLNPPSFDYFFFAAGSRPVSGLVKVTPGNPSLLTRLDVACSAARRCVDLAWCVLAICYEIVHDLFA